ncbi:MAG TPA: hypothetical protein VF486_22365 [Actinomycetes bacterium]
MSDDDALRGEMGRFGHHLDRDPLDLDEGTAERLLAGTLDPADAPPAYAAVAQVLAAAAAPRRPEELAGEAEALARFRSSSPIPPVRAGRRLARLAVVAAALAGVLSVGGVGFATGVLPRTGQWINRTVQSVVGTAPASTAAPARTEPGSSTSTLLGGRGGPAAPSTTPGSVQSPPSGAVPGSTAAAEALCKAWQPGKGEHMDPAALQALATAAGGSDHIPAYCRAVKKDQGSGSDNGNGNGQGDGNGQGGGGGAQGASQATPGAASQNAPGAASQATPGAASRNAPGTSR